MRSVLLAPKCRPECVRETSRGNRTQSMVGLTEGSMVVPSPEEPSVTRKCPSPCRELFPCRSTGVLVYWSAGCS